MSARQVKYYVTIETGQGLGSLRALESQAMRVEQSFAQIRSMAQSTAGALGIAFAGREVVGFGKDLIETQAKFEAFRNLIKFSSSNAAEAAANLNEVKKAVTDFKLPIEETFSAYAKLMGALKGTPLQGEGGRQMFTDISEVARAVNISTADMSRAYLALQEMFGEGRIQTRHFVGQFSRAFSAVGILPETAQLLGTTTEDIFKRLKTTDPKEKLDPYKVLPELFHKLAAEYLPHLDESLHSSRAELTELNNEWLIFKDTLGTKLKPEFIELFHELESGIDYLKAHEDGLISLGKAVIKVAQFWAAYKVSMLAVNAATSIYRSITGVLFTETVHQSEAYIAQARSIDSVTAAIERLNFATNAQNGATIRTAAGGIVSNTAGNRYMVAMEGAAAGSMAVKVAPGVVAAEGAATGAGAVETGALGGIAAFLGSATFVQGALMVAIGAASIYALRDAIGGKGSSPRYNEFGDRVNSLTGKHFVEDKNYYFYDEKTGKMVFPGGRLEADKEIIQPWNERIGDQIMHALGINDGMFGNTSKTEDVGKTNKLNKPADPTHIRGNTVTNININIPKLVGQENCKFELRSIKDFDDKDFAAKLVRTLTDVVNDSQIVAHH